MDNIVPAFSSVKRYTRLAFGLRDFLKNPITLEQCIELVTARLRNREANFIDLVQRCIYQNPASPYIKLLNVAGCDFEDMKALIEKDGIEATLKNYLTKEYILALRNSKGNAILSEEENIFFLKKAILIILSCLSTIKLRPAVQEVKGPKPYSISAIDWMPVTILC